MTRRKTHGTLLQLSDGAASNPAFSTIAHVRNMVPPPESTQSVELADHDMEHTKMYLPAGLSDMGEAEFEIYLDPQDVGHQALLELVKAKTTEDWRIVLPGGAGTFSGPAYVAKFEVGDIDANDGVLEATLALQATDEWDMA